MGQWPIGESPGADCSPRGKRSLSSDDSLLAQVPLQRRQRPQVEIAREDQPDCRSFFLVDHQFAVLDLIAEGNHATDPKPLLLGGRDFVSDALAGDLSLELGERQQHVEGQPPMLVVGLNDWLTDTKATPSS